MEQFQNMDDDIKSDTKNNKLAEIVQESALLLELENMKRKIKFLEGKQAGLDKVMPTHELKDQRIRKNWSNFKELSHEIFDELIADESPIKKTIVPNPTADEIYFKTPIKRKKSCYKACEKPVEPSEPTLKTTRRIPIDRATARDFDKSPIKTPGEKIHLISECQTCGQQFEAQVFPLFMRKCVAKNCLNCQKINNNQTSENIKDEDILMEFRQFKALEEVKTYYKTEPEEEGAALK